MLFCSAELLSGFCATTDEEISNEMRKIVFINPPLKKLKTIQYKTVLELNFPSDPAYPDERMAAKRLRIYDVLP